MARNKEIIVTLGTTRVTIADFSWGPNGLELNRAISRSINYFDSAETEWITSVGDTINSICKEYKIKGLVKVVLPSSQLLSKTIRVPKVEELKQREVVSDELGQKMPFPLSSMIWDYQIIDDDGIEQEILAFAVKPHFIDDICRTLFKSHLITTHLCPGTILDREVLSQSKHLAKYSEIMLINLGARSTNLLFCNPQGYLARSLNIGGNLLTNGLSEAFGLPLDKAEELKINYSLGRLKSATSDSSLDILKTVANNYYNKIGQEISRSLVTYKRLKKGKCPQIMVLTGCAAKDPNIIEFLSNAQEIPVVLFDPKEYLNPESLEIIDNQDELKYTLTESLGFAQLTQTGRDVISLINLLPSNRLRALEFKKKKIWLMISAIFITLSPLPYIYKKINSIKEENIYYIKQVNNYKNKEIELSQVKEKKKNLIYYQSINQKGINFINDFRKETNRLYSHPRLINEIQNITLSGYIQNIWIDSINFVEPLPSSIPPSVKNQQSNFLTVELQGRYLVSSTDEPNEKIDPNERREKLIDLNSIIQQNLTESLSKISMVQRLTKKSFSTDGKGDLFNRYYTHFVIQAEVDLLK